MRHLPKGSHKPNTNERCPFGRDPMRRYGSRARARALWWAQEGVVLVSLALLEHSQRHCRNLPGRPPCAEYEFCRCCGAALFWLYEGERSLASFRIFSFQDSTKKEPPNQDGGVALSIECRAASRGCVSSISFTPGELPAPAPGAASVQARATQRGSTHARAARQHAARTAQHAARTLHVAWMLVRGAGCATRALAGGA